MRGLEKKEMGAVADRLEEIGESVLRERERERERERGG